MLKKLAPGIYVKDRQLEIDVPELLAELGFEDTEENRDRCVKYAEGIFRELGMITSSTTVRHTHGHRCPRCGNKWGHAGKLKKCQLKKQAICGRCNS